MFRWAILSYLLIVNASCKKGQAGATDKVKGTVSFLANDTLYRWTEDFSVGSSLNMGIAFHGGSTPVFALTVSNSPGAFLKRSLTFPIYAVSLATNTPYTYASGSGYLPISIQADSNKDPFSLTIDPRSYESFEPGDSGTITFTSIKNNRAAGIFTAKLSRRSDKARINITGGRFENVLVW